MKVGTKWDLGGTSEDAKALDFTDGKGSDAHVNGVDVTLKEEEVSTSLEYHAWRFLVRYNCYFVLRVW